MSLTELEELSVISKICQELENHVGISDKGLAEFIMALYREATGDLGRFQSLLDENGAEFPASFCQSLHRMIAHLLQGFKDASMNYKPAAEDGATDGDKTLQFPGLALPNMERKDLDSLVEIDQKEDSLKRQELHSTLDELERLRTKVSSTERADESDHRRRRSRSRSLSPRRGNDRNSYRRRNRSRSHSRSPEDRYERRPRKFV